MGISSVISRPVWLGIAALVLALGAYFGPWASQPTQAVPELCQPGYYSATGSAPCDPAPLGHFVDIQGATSPSECPPGTYNDLLAMTTCQAADPGYYAAGYANQVQTLCPAGSTSEARATGCVPTSSSACWSGDWQSLVDSSGSSFGSQLACAAYVGDSPSLSGRGATIVRILLNRWGRFFVVR